MAIETPKIAQNTGLYADLNSLQSIKDTAKTDESAALRQVAQQFEQIFLHTLLKTMREANRTIGEDNVFNGGQVSFYEDMLDEQLTLEMAQGKGIGLTDVLVRQLSSQLSIGGAEKSSFDPLVTDAQLTLRRAFDQGGSLAAAAVLGQAQGSELDTALEQTMGELQRRKQALYAEKNTQQDGPDVFESPKQFVETLLPMAEKVAAELGVDPKVLLAQSALETGWGKHMVRGADGSNSYNLFNIKASRGWQGDTAATKTLEYRNGVMGREVAQFRAYDNYEQSFRDYVKLLKDSPRYQQALESAGNPHEYIQKLQDAGYATDPNYAKKITNIFENSIKTL